MKNTTKTTEPATGKYSYIAASVEAKFLGATNTRGSRVKITSVHLKKSKTIGWDYQYSGTAEQAIKAILPEIAEPQMAAPRVTYSETTNGYLIQFHGSDDRETVKKFFGVMG